MAILIPAAVVFVILLVPALMFNSLIGKRNQVRNIFATTDALLKKRYDLLPNLVSTVKGYMTHERQLLEKVTQLRAKALEQTGENRIATENEMTKLLAGVMVAVENYPQLKASENFLHLQRTLTELEEQISAARRAYNASVTDYNNTVQMFPTNLMAAALNFKTKSLLVTPGHERENVDVAKFINS